MGRRKTGAAFEKRGKFYARPLIGGERKCVMMPAVASLEEARERGLVIVTVVAKLEAQNHFDRVKAFVAELAAAPAGDVGEIVGLADDLCEGRVEKFDGPEGTVRETVQVPIATAVLQLWPHQKATIQSAYGLRSRGVKRVLVVLPTGSGKTVVASRLVLDAVRAGERVLFLAHRRELINQAHAQLLRAGIDTDQIGVIMGNDTRSSPNAVVQVASIDSLRRRDCPPADLVIVDEAHRALAGSYRRVIEMYPQAWHVGLTATPYRLDGQGLGDVYNEIVAVARPSELIRAGRLVAPVVYTVPKEKLPDLDGVRPVAGDYNLGALSRAVNQKALVGNIVDEWLRLAEGRRTVVFAVSVEHSLSIVERFVAAGVTAEHLDGSTTTEERDAILGRLQSGETKVVSNCMVLAEGWDMPCCKCLVLARPTQSLSLHIQQSGRISRPWRGVCPIILDHAANTLTHGLPHQDREFSLGGVAPAGGAGGGIRACKNCQALNLAGDPFCPGCGCSNASATRPKLLSEVEGELELVVDSLRFEPDWWRSVGTCNEVA